MKRFNHNVTKIKNSTTGNFEGLPAIAGESAYEIAKRLGTFSGTEEEWNNYIKTERDEAITAIENKGKETLESIPEDYTTLQNDVDELKSDLADSKLVFDVDFSSATSGYVSANTIKTSSRFYKTEPFGVKKGYTIKLKVCGYYVGSASEVNIVSKYDRANDQYFLIVPSVSSNTTEYIYTFLEDCEIVVSFDNTLTHKGVYYNSLENYLTKDNQLKVKTDLSEYFEGGIVNKSMGVYGTSSALYKHIVIDVEEGEEYCISGSSNNKDYAGAWYRYNGNTKEVLIQGNNQTFENLVVKIPSDVDQLVVNGFESLHKLEVYKLSLYTGDDVSKLEQKVTVLEKETDSLKFEIKTIKSRCLRAEKGNDFAWSTFDKAYFCFVVDDCNSFTPKAIRLFETNNVPLSSAVIVGTLNTVYDGETKTIKESLADMVESGGEVLSHYSYNLYETSTDEEWYEHTVLPKETLEKNGFVCDGIIRANSTTIGSDKGERYCREYYRYSDNLGKSTQYSSSRKFFMSFSTLQDIYNYIDTCCNTKGFFPFCMHGNRSDEPLATEENLQSIIDYIKSKGVSVADFTTYRDIYDEFGSTVLEERIKALETLN